MAKGKNLFSFFIPGLAIGVALLGVVGFALYWLAIKQPMEAQAEKLLSARVAERAQTVSTKTSQIQKNIALASSLYQSQPEADLIKTLKAQVPEIDQVKIFNGDSVELDLQSQPLITHVTVDMLNQALAGEQPSPEYILSDGQGAYIAFVQPLGNGKALLAAMTPSKMTSLLGYSEDGTFVELRQEFQGAQHTVAQVGEMNGDGALVTSPNFGANWTVVMGQKPDNFFTQAGILPLILLIGGGLALLIAALLPFFSLQRILNKDARAFIQGVNRKQLPYKFNLKFFNDIAASFNRNQGFGDAATTDSAPPPVVEPEVVTKEKAEQSMVVDLMAVAAKINPSLFREYDIRGEADKDLTADVVFAIGKAIGSEAYNRGEQKVIVGRDGRESSPTLQTALIQGLQASGRDVIDVGMVATPLLYYSTHVLNSRSGVMVTGSHNPSNHNGLKIVLNGETLYGQDIQNILMRIKNDDFLNGQGTLSEVDIEQSYLERLVDDIKLEKTLKVVIDCGNGVTGAMAPRIFQALGCEVVGLHTEVDGSFPNHHPDPNKYSNLKDLIRAVKTEKANLGIAYDGDGDRLGIVDERGKVIWTDRLMMLFAMDVLQRNTGADILYDVKCTRHLPEIIKQNGGTPIMWKTGHSLMKAKMHETGAVLGGEGSGHVYFKERWFGFDDAFYASARLLELLGRDPRTASEMFSSLPESLESEEINVPVPDKVKFKLIDALIEKGSFGENSYKNTIDGLRVEYDHGWLLARASNTTPSIVVKFEADDQESLEKLKDTLKTQLLSIAPKLKLNF